MKRALYITHKEIFPVVGGDQVRFSQQLSMLAENYDTDVLSLTHNPRAAAPSTLYVPRLRRYVRSARTLLNRLPEVVNHYRDPRVDRFVAEHAASYDIVLCGSPAMSQYCPEGHAGARLDMTDSLAMNCHNAAASTRSALRRAWLREQEHRLATLEADSRRRFGRVAYISEVDRDFVAENAEKTAIVGNYVELPSRADLCPHSARARDVAFLGRLDYEPNIQAATHFAGLWRGGVAPAGAKFNIVGGYATAAVRALEGDGVRLLGFVPNLADVWRHNALIVAPMLSGSGIQNKILQAMAHCCCVVTTPIGAEGLEGAPQADALIVSEPGEAFGRAVAELLANRDRRSAVGVRARDFVASHFNRAAIQAQFNDFIS